MLEHCVRCGVGLDSAFKFCPACGLALGQLDDSPTLTAERRLLTVLFCDLVGSTQLSDRLDSEELRDVLSDYHRTCAKEVLAHGGHVAQYLGDGVLTYFGWPRAHEDDAVRALRCGLKIIESLATMPPRHGVRMIARLGADSGQVIVSAVGAGAEQESLALGDIPNVAARVQSQAQPGTLYVSDRTWTLAHGYFKGVSIGRPHLKGLANPIEVWRVDARTGARSRLEAAAQFSPFVGRDTDLALAERFLTEPAMGVQWLDISGEPGIGKSRLLAELHSRLTKGQQPARGSDAALAPWVLLGTCAQERQLAPLSLFAQIVRAQTERFSLDASLGIAEMLQEVALDSSENRGLLALLLDAPVPEGSLADLDGTLIGLHTHDLLLKWLLAPERSRNVVLFLEDLHWLDATSQELLGRIAAASGPNGLRIVSTRRPEYQPPWQGLTSVRRLDLLPLSSDAIGRIIAARMGPALDESLATLLTQRAEGNALFAEELASFVKSAARTQEGGPDARALLQSMPDSVRSLIDARVDGLLPQERDLLQAAAVIGRQFDPELLGAVMPSVEDQQARLRHLAALDLLVDGPRGRFSFKHALIQDALYDRLLRPQAAQLHERVARTLQKQFADSLDDVAEALAYHWSRADDPLQTVLALTRAGRKARDRFALNDASLHLEAAAAVVDKNPETFSAAVVLPLLRLLTHVHYVRLEAAACIQRVERHLVLVNRHLDDADAVHVLGVYVFACCLARRMRTARDAAERVWAACLSQSDQQCRAQAAGAYLAANAIARSSDGDSYPAALAEAQRLCEQSRDPFIVNDLLMIMAWDAFGQGRHERVYELTRRLAERGQMLSDPRAEAVALWLEGWVEFNDERYVECIRKTERVLEIAVTPYDQQNAMSQMGLSLIFSRRPDNGLPLVRKNIEDCSRLGAHYIATASAYGLPAALIATGRPSEGMSLLDEAIAESVRCEDHRLIAQQRAVKAEILMSFLDPPPELSWREKLSLIARSPGFFFRVMPRAAHHAELLLQQALAYPRFSNPRAYWHARLVTDLALLQSRRRPKSKSRERLLRARALAQSHDARSLVVKVDRALARLGG